MKSLAEYGEPCTEPQPLGWLTESNRRAIRLGLLSEPHDVVEIGSFAGMSTGFICESAPLARVFCVDPWRFDVGSEMDGIKTYRRALGGRTDVFDLFHANLWGYRDRVYPVHQKSAAGLKYLADRGVNPSLVYVDGSHDHADVVQDLVMCFTLFPFAVVVVDDYYTAGPYTWEGVRCAVDDVRAMRDDRVFEVVPSVPGDIDHYATAVFRPSIN